MASNFWTNSPTKDPKRGFRFRVMIPGIDPNYLWYAKTANKPTVSFGEASHSYLNHTYYWPGRAEWNEVSVTLVDPIEPRLTGNMAALVQAAGYTIPADPNQLRTMSKSSSTILLNKVLIEQIDEEGNTIETWTLNNAWVKELTWGDLDYSSDDLVECTIKFRYDWASLTAESDTLANVDTDRANPFFQGPGSPSDV